MPAALLTCPTCRKVVAARSLAGGTARCGACGHQFEATSTLAPPGVGGAGGGGGAMPLMARLPMWSAQFRARYELVRALGKGAMGVVYLMRQVQLGRLVAVKVVSDEHEDGPGTAGLVKEAKFMASLNHPNIVAIHDVGVDGDKAYMVCEYVEGESLDQRLKRPPPLGPAAILGCAIQLLDGLTAAHARGIVHRDLKPANVFLTAEGQAKIGDFGLARAHAAPSQTGAGLLTGTPPYMSPEQCRGRPATPASDIYALGIILFELCTGQRPFPGPYLPDYVQQHTLQKPPRPRSLKPELPAVLETIILRALEKDPSARFQSAAEMRVPLQGLLNSLQAPGRSAPGLPAPLAPRASGLESRLAPGARLSGRYELVRVIGQGGMGQVWLAHDQAMDGAPVAIKMLPPELGRDPEARTNLKSEARLSQRLAHPNVVRLFTLEPGDPPYLVLEFVDGPSLGELMARRRETGQGPLSPRECIPLLDDVAAALDHSHEHNLIHRDVKPSNVLLEARPGKPTRAKLGDFGIAAELTTFRSKQTGGVKPGTLAYMSPEQVACQRMDIRADVYSLAATLYDMLALRPPFTGGDITWAIQNAPVPRPDGLAESIWKVLESGLAKSVADRPPTCGALARAFRLAVEGPPPSAPPLSSQASTGQPSDAIASRSAAGGVATAVDASMAPAGASPASEATTVPLRPPRPVSSDDVAMVLVPACRFSMGAEDGGVNEQPVHAVELSEFEIDSHPVTNTQFARFVAATQYRTVAEREGKGFGFDGFEIVWVEGVDWRHPMYPEDSIEDKGDHPVVQVAWEDAVAYCRWAGKRLPTEAEWECAARGGLMAARYPWGDAPPAGRCHFDQPLTARLVPVAQGDPNPFGLHDMAGNVWQWCADTYHDHFYKACPVRDPVCTITGTMRVVRGGALVGMAYDVRCARRMGMNATGRNWYTGFRAARGVR